MTVVELRNQGLFEFNPSLITAETTEVLLSDNQLTTLPSKCFRGRSRIWTLDLSGNFLADLSFLKPFGALGYVDLRNNCLAFDELLDIVHIYIAHLRVDANPFSKYTEAYPLTLPALLERAWIIDGEFISDSIRRQAKAFRETIAFGETVLACRRVQTTISPLTGVSQIAVGFLASDTVKYTKRGEVISSAGVQLQSNDQQPQLQRLRHLSTLYPPVLPSGTFLDYLSVALGILSIEWMKEPMDAIPRVFCHGYWVLKCGEMVNLEQYERLLLLLLISDRARPQTDVEQELWKSLALAKYLQTGDVPVHGSSPRLLLSAFLERSPDKTEDAADRFFYLKIREHGRFTDCSVSLEQIHREVLAPIPIIVPNWPAKGSKVVVRHPATDEWVTAVCLSYRKGRVFTQVGNDQIQIPQIGLFWDGKAWREVRKKNDPVRTRPVSPFVEPKSSPAVSFSGALVNFSQRYGKQHLPPLAEPAQSDTRSLLQSGIQLMTTSKFVDRTMRPPSTFHGISEPNPRPRTAILRTPPTRRPNQFIRDVVNVVWGPEGNARRLRRFNLRVENMITHKSQYIWIVEDEIAQEDVARLVEMYRLHIGTRMTIIPGL
jgi:hypothetical protein